MTSGERTASRTAASAAARVRPPTCTPPIETRRASRAGSFGFDLAFGLGLGGGGGGGGMGIVVVVPVVDVVAVVVVVESVRADEGGCPASTEAVRSPATPRLRRTTAEATLRTVRSVALLTELDLR
jgi:uncharacterized membrane protein